MKPKLSLRFRLGLLVAGTALPLIGFAAAVVYRHHIEKREEAFHQVLQLVRSTRLILDSETHRIVAGLQVLALSPALQTGDFEAFRTNADVRLVWQEKGGPKVQGSERRGFGTALIQKGLSDQLGGEATLEFMPDGVRCVLRAPAS